jgi:hypothetical protein
VQQSKDTALACVNRDAQSNVEAEFYVSGPAFRDHQSNPLFALSCKNEQVEGIAISFNIY